MQKPIILLLFVILGLTPGTLNSQKSTRTFIHPGMLQTRSDLELMKQKIDNGEQPWKDAYDRLSKSVSLDFQPEPFTHVIRGPYGRPSIGGKELSSSADAAYEHSLMWYITGDKSHARKAIEIINAWSSVLWDFDDNDAKLLAGWTGHLFCNAAEILRYTESGWEEKDVAQFKLLLLTAFNSLGLSAASALFNQVFLFIPNIIVAVLVLILGLFLANFISQALVTYLKNIEIQNAESIGNLTNYAIIVFVISIADSIEHWKRIDF